MATADTTRFKVDEEWFDVPEGVETFDALREQVLDDLNERGLVLLGILRGEAALSPDEVAGMGGRPLAELDTLEFLSAEPLALARRICADMGEILARLGERAEETASHLVGGESSEALNGLKDCAEGWSTVLQTYRDLLRLAGVDPSTVEIGGRSFTAVTNELRGLLERMGRDFEKRDMDGVRDLLIHELALFIDPLREAFDDLRDRLD